MAEEKHIPNIEITELFLAKAGNDWSRTFVGTIERYAQEDGSKLVVGRIPVHGFEVLCNATDDILLGNYLDEMVLLILNYNLHEMAAINC